MFITVQVTYHQTLGALCADLTRPLNQSTNTKDFDWLRSYYHTVCVLRRFVAQLEGHGSSSLSVYRFGHEKPICCHPLLFIAGQGDVLEVGCDGRPLDGLLSRHAKAQLHAYHQALKRRKRSCLLSSCEHLGMNENTRQLYDAGLLCLESLPSPASDARLAVKSSGMSIPFAVASFPSASVNTTTSNTLPS